MNWFRKLFSAPEANSGEVLVQRTQLRIADTEGMRRIVRHEMSRLMAQSGRESFEEADDFELDDGDDWVSPYEEVFEPEPETMRGVGRSPTETAPAPAPSPADPSVTNVPPPPQS